MARFDDNEIITCYFIIVEDRNGRRIHAWTESKELIKAYMEFHKCKDFELKKSTQKAKDMVEVMNENLHDEIQICNITTKNKNGKKKDGNIKNICIPATTTEMNFINTESDTFMASRVGYGYLNDVIPYLKKKYQIALRDIFLRDVIDIVVNRLKSKRLQYVEFDQLLILLKSFPNSFGR